MNALNRLQTARSRIPVPGIEAEFMHAARNTVQLVARYAQPEFAYAIVNPPMPWHPRSPRIRPPLIGFFQVATGQGHWGNTSPASPA